jgi:signal transduction histidine kinase
VQIESSVEVPIRDSRVATQLYRIAQEAVTNAVKHAKPRTIRIQISADSALMTLRVIDDGTGIQEPVPKQDGLGLRIMNFRAASIGALLSVAPGTGGGTVVTCTLRGAPRPTQLGTV